jgi:putative phosphoribosyl transferase
MNLLGIAIFRACRVQGQSIDSPQILTKEHVMNVSIRSGRVELPGTLVVPTNAQGIVIFAHGSGSSRLSPRNRQVAEALNQVGLGTLLFDLLTDEESLDRANVFDIQLLADRLNMATRWVKKQSELSVLSIGYFGASTGAGAALWAAADAGNQVLAVVSRGGRPDLAIPRLPEVQAPTLLIVGGNDEPVIEMNQEALRYLKTAELKIIPGATHLFEEPGTLEEVAKNAGDWFKKHLTSKTGRKAA